MKSVQKNIHLNRELGLFSAICLIINVMTGSGIFVSVDTVLRNTGSMGMCLVIWVACGLLSLLGALSFAELSAVVPKSGGEYNFYQAAFADSHKFWGPVPGFVYTWVSTVCVCPAEMAIILLTFAEYFIQALGLWVPMSSDAKPELKKAVGVLTLCIITFINYVSVKCFVNTQNAFTVCKIVVCLFVVYGGFYQLYLGHDEHLMTGFEGTTLSITTMPMAFYSGLWAYEGWMTSISISEEIKNPQRNILLSIIIAVLFVTVINVLVNISYLTVLSVPEIISTPDLAVEFGGRALGHFMYIIPLGVAIATFGCALSCQFNITRICFAASINGQMLEVFSYVNIKKLIPTPAAILQSLLTFIALMCGDILTLIEFTSFLRWGFHGISMVALLVLRYTKSDTNHTFKVSTIIPIAVLFASIVLFLVPIITDPKPQFIIAVAFVLSAFVIYIPFVYQKRRLSVIDVFADCVKRTMAVKPTENDELDTDTDENLQHHAM